MKSEVVGIEPRIESRETTKGWLVVFAAMIGVAVGLSPVPFYTIGMFAPELSQRLRLELRIPDGQHRRSIRRGHADQPRCAGFVIDRYGARNVAIVSLILFGLCFMSLGLSTGSLALYYGQWVVMSVLGAGTLSATWTRVVNGWFDRNRGLALGVASTGTGLTGFLIKPLTAWLIAQLWLAHGIRRDRHAADRRRRADRLAAVPRKAARRRRRSGAARDGGRRGIWLDARASAARSALLDPGGGVPPDRLRAHRADAEHGEHPQDVPLRAGADRRASPRASAWR